MMLVRFGVLNAGERRDEELARVQVHFQAARSFNGHVASGEDLDGSPERPVCKVQTAWGVSSVCSFFRTGSLSTVSDFERYWKPLAFVGLVLSWASNLGAGSKEKIIEWSQGMDRSPVMSVVGVTRNTGTGHLVGQRH